MPSNRISFVDLPEQKEFGILPNGVYTARIANLQDREAGPQAKNPGARMLRWEFEVINNEDYDSRRIWDNQVCTPQTMWKIKALLNAVNVDTSSLSFDEDDNQFYYEDDKGDEHVLDMDELLGSVVDIKVGKRPARTDPETNREYAEQNKITQFYVHEASDADLLA